LAKSVLYTSCSRIACASSESPTVYLCIDDPTILATIVCPAGTTPYQPTTIDAILTKTWKDGSRCGTGMWRYLFQYDENDLADPTGVLTAEDITGVFCAGCLTDWIEDAINRRLCALGLL
jgi:hypothetical protein